MAPRAILVTGSDGFVGHHLLARLAADFPDATIHPAAFDVTDAPAIDAAVAALKPDACIHLAAIAAIAEARDAPERAWDVNLGGTLSLARALRRHVPDCALLYVSSADAYGGSFSAGVPLDESAPLAPMNTYGATKAAADLALGAMARDGLRVVRLRPFNHTGPGQSEAFVVAAFARQVARVAAGRQPPVLRVGTLDARRDFLDVRDVAAAYSLCLARADTLAPGTVLNVASGEGRRIGDILDALLALSGVQAAVETDTARLRRAEIPLAAGNATLARDTLGWTPAVPWETTLRDVLQDWHGRV
ncbi:MAG: GDP-mannose 4,6-dehydratase [Janthinobacterium lividum]